jgi:transcriptional regulator with XRE-family HTH domain
MADLLSRLDGLLTDERDQVAYKHELAISSFTNDVARLLAEHGVSQSELARRLGVSRARVSQLMRHASSPTLRTMIEVAAALGCDVNLGVAPCGLRQSESYVAEGGTTGAGYRATSSLSETPR